MIKSINYQPNNIVSIEVSNPADIETLGDSYGEGSTVRVVGILEEYTYTKDNGWIIPDNGSDTPMPLN